MLNFEPVDRIRWDAKTCAILAAAIALIGVMLAWVNQSPPREQCYIDAVKRQLHDPVTAIFDNVTITERGATGYVNARNLMGAYTGSRLFVVEGGCGGQVTILPSANELRAATR